MILGTNLVPAEGEQVIRTYHCASFKSKLLNIAVEGHLEVTNKRVVFQATGRGGLLHSEVPIQDVSGISLYKGTYFSWRHFLGALLLAIVLSVAIGVLLVTIAHDGDQDLATGIAWACAAIALLVSFLPARGSILRPGFVAISSGALGALAGIGFFDLDFLRYVLGGYRHGLGLSAILAVLMSIYLFVCELLYAIRPLLSVAVNSKGGGYSPISIVGAGSGGSVYGAAARMLSAEPAADAENMIRELGALIMDVQQLGDLGIDRWKS